MDVARECFPHGGVRLRDFQGEAMGGGGDRGFDVFLGITVAAARACPEPVEWIAAWVAMENAARMDCGNVAPRSLRKAEGVTPNRVAKGAGKSFVTLPSSFESDLQDRRARRQEQPRGTIQPKPPLVRSRSFAEHLHE